MRTIVRAVVVSLVVLASVVMSPGAWADPVPQPDFEAALSAAADGSGMFAPGTTVVMALRAANGDDALTISVNPDGSLVGERTTADGLTRIRCVRVDRCWTQSALAFRDAKWHLMAPGSVTYRNAREYWWTEVVGMPHPEGTAYAIEPMDDGTPLYVTMYGSTDSGMGRGTYFEGLSVTTADMLVMGGNPEVSSMTVIRVASQPVVVRPPATSALGRKARLPDYWTAPINS